MVTLEKIKGKKMTEVTFSHPGAPGHNVSLAGVFNDWDPARTPMLYCDEKKSYICILTLSSGEYEYKLVVDGQWMLDEGNPNFVSNDFGTLNSIVVVK